MHILGKIVHKSYQGTNYRINGSNHIIPTLKFLLITLVPSTLVKHHLITMWLDYNVLSYITNINNTTGPACSGKDDSICCFGLRAWIKSRVSSVQR